jgi:hypothetical protein
MHSALLPKKKINKIYSLWEKKPGLISQSSSKEESKKVKLSPQRHACAKGIGV